MQKELIKKKIIQNFFKKNIKPNLNLFESGILDSLRVIELIEFIEKKTKKKISKKKLNQKSFENIKNILKIF